MGDRPPGNWRMPRHMPRPMPPQHNSQATNVSHLTEMSLAIATQNRQSAEIIERFCANMTNESRLFNRRDSCPEYNNDYVELDLDPNDPYGTNSNNQAPYEGGGNNQSGAPRRPKDKNQYVESDFSPNNPYGAENIIEVPVQDNQAPYQGNSQTLYEGEGNNQFSHGDHAEGSNNQTPYEGRGNNQTPPQNNQAPNEPQRRQWRIRREYIEPLPEPGFDDVDNPYEAENNQAPYEGGGNNQTPYGGGGSSEAIAQAETSNQGKELLPNMRERERDSQDSQPRNDRSRSPPPQRERECHRPRAMIQPKKRRG
ncbi:uncharacterized protein CCOS01_10644 [Colletotrichum costaricense]|uniref:Uncharacterized protein n=1 Tax=Colletotrichum costaricense TaxID=1209916 RepID=A0AAI9YR95_9PEZI|nr:uncharacterized protein CCOS01_10644 [Colletotrichum costaricense]KAK1520525.1 hypothetical protein CCOS01_10644 [Colletotrichum costaricense]